MFSYEGILTKVFWGAHTLEGGLESLHSGAVQGGDLGLVQTLGDQTLDTGQDSTHRTEIKSLGYQVYHYTIIQNNVTTSSKSYKIDTKCISQEQSYSFPFLLQSDKDF